MEFAFNICKYVKSNAIVLCKNFSTIGIGAGQPSRLDSCRLAVQKARKFRSMQLSGSIAASDAFFPFKDGIEQAGDVGVKLVIQPGGSIRDQEVIDEAKSRGISMVFTNRRLFRH